MRSHKTRTVVQYAVPQHNDGRWFEVREFTEQFRRLQANGRKMNIWKPGWYVVRICPCHFELPVTVTLPSEAVAERARDKLIAAAIALGTA